MINNKIISQASKTNFYGLKKKYTHKYKMKNKNCGDIINLEVIIKNQKFKSMRYETESCVLCEASASLLAKKVKNLSLKDLKKDIIFLKEIKKNKKFNFPPRYKEFKQILNQNTLKRANCVILPFDAIIKAFKFKK